MNTTTGGGPLTECRYSLAGSTLTVGLFTGDSNRSLSSPDKNAVVLTFDLTRHKSGGRYYLNYKDGPTGFGVLGNGRRCPLGKGIGNGMGEVHVGAFQTAGASIDFHVPGFNAGVCSDTLGPIQAEGGSSSGTSGLPPGMQSFPFDFGGNAEPAADPPSPIVPPTGGGNPLGGGGSGTGTVGGMFRAVSGQFAEPPPSTASGGGTSGTSGTSGGGACQANCEPLQKQCTAGLANGNTPVQAVCYCAAACVAQAGLSNPAGCCDPGREAECVAELRARCQTSNEQARALGTTCAATCQ